MVHIDGVVAGGRLIGKEAVGMTAVEDELADGSVVDVTGRSVPLSAPAHLLKTWT